MDIREYFSKLRHNDLFHLGLGDVRMTMGMQDEIVHEFAHCKKALRIASEMVALRSGTCPNDTDGWYRPEEGSCEDLCETGIEKECWKMFFESEALKEK